MEKAVEKYDELVIYGAGNMGQVVIRNLIGRGWRDRIVCCAVTNSENNVRRILNDVQVIELKWLLHLRESACFIIAVAENKQTEIYKKLVQFGCKNIKVMEYSYALELQYHQMKRFSSDDIIKEKLLQLEEKIDQIDCQIQEQNEICATNTAAFKKFENCNYGKDVVVVASGPTMQYYKPLKSAIHIGMNSTWKRNDINFDYFFVLDWIREQRFYDLWDGIFKNVKGEIFIARYLRNSLRGRKLEYPVLTGIEEKRIHRFWKETYSSDIYQNICYHALMNYSSVVFPAIQFAFYTHPKRIYLVGCDVSNKGDFDQIENIFPRWQLNILKCGYARIKEFAEQHYPQTEIISINPVGLKGLFQDEFTENFKKG